MPEVLQDDAFDPVQIGRGVQVFCVRRFNIQFIVRAKVFVILVTRDF